MNPFLSKVFAIFLVLQALDVITTMIGLDLGAGESSVVVSRLLELGHLQGLLVSKAFGILLMAAALMMGRGRVMRILNPWYALVVTWNLVVIVTQARGVAGALEKVFFHF